MTIFENKRDFLKKMKTPELQAGYMKFLIPRPDKKEEPETVWGWLSPENLQKVSQPGFTGSVKAILLNQPTFDFEEKLRWGIEVPLEYEADRMPVLSPEWIQEKFYKEKNHEK